MTLARPGTTLTAPKDQGSRANPSAAHAITIINKRNGAARETRWRRSLKPTDQDRGGQP
jgi:hypothetical protein